MGLTFDAGAFVASARRGDATAVSLFLLAGMKPDQSPGDLTALELALDGGHMAIARTLIEAGAAVDRALPSVVRNGNLELFQLLLSKKPGHKVLVWCLCLAAGGGHTLKSSSALSTERVREQDVTCQMSLPCRR